MAENGSVGMISLDLVIKEKLTEQLDKIKARVSAPAAKVGETMQAAVDKPMKNVGKSMTDSMKQARQLPVTEILRRTGLPKKTAERYRKYLVAGTLILDGDYPGLAEYMSYIDITEKTEESEDGREVKGKHRGIMKILKGGRE